MISMDIFSWFRKTFGCNVDYYIDLYNAASSKNSELSDEIDSLNEKIQILQQQIDNQENDAMKPTWLDTSQYPYEPYIVIQEGSTTFTDPRDIYAESRTLASIVSKWKTLPLNQKLMKIWGFVIDALTYRYDVNENWQFPIVTYYMKLGDCEDGTILFVTLCHLAGIKADKVFNACGWFTQGTNKYGHSFPIAQMEDGKWYIFETTIDNHPSVPMLFYGSNYDASWGVCNWTYYGKIIGGDQI
jgi:transglutaminase-like putative cysteine protease